MNLNKKINRTATNATAVYISKWVIGVCAMVIASAANAEWQLDPVLRVGWDYDDNAAMSIRTDGEEQISGPVAEAAVDIRSDTETSYMSLRPRARTRNDEDKYNRDSDDGFLRDRTLTRAFAKRTPPRTFFAKSLSLFSFLFFLEVPTARLRIPKKKKKKICSLFSRELE